MAIGEGTGGPGFPPEGCGCLIGLGLIGILSVRDMIRIKSREEKERKKITISEVVEPEKEKPKVLDLKKSNLYIESREPPKQLFPEDLDTDRFSIEEMNDGYRFHNIVYRGKHFIVDWRKELSNWGENTGDWIVPDIPIYYSTLTALFHAKDGPQSGLVEKLRGVFHDDFEKGVRTSTHLYYDGYDESDFIIHFYGYDSKKYGKGKFRFTGAGLRKITNEDRAVFYGPYPGHITDAIFGTYDVDTLDKVFRWVTNKKLHFENLPNEGSGSEIMVTLRTEECLDDKKYLFVDADHDSMKVYGKPEEVISLPARCVRIKPVEN